MASNSVVPEWVNETPPDHSYSLDMYQNSDVSIQSVELTREEFITLKVHLAEMRGLARAAVNRKLL